MNSDHSLSAEGLARVAIAIAAASVLAHYAVQALVLVLGGHPRVDDISSLMINSAVAAAFLWLGWLIRRPILSMLLFLGIGLIFITPYLFILRGSLASWGMQFSVYIGLPIISTLLFIGISKGASVPTRPVRRKPQQESAAL